MNQVTIRCRYTKPEGSTPGRRSDTSTASRWLDRIMLIAGLVCAAAIGVFLLTGKAKAQPAPCFPFTVLRDSLKERYHETAIGGGILNPKAILQVFASPNGETFTIIATRVDGVSCILFTGRDWQPGTLPVGGQEG